MAKVKNGLISGKMGNLIYYVQDGIQYSRAVSAKPTKPATLNQAQYREKMAITSKFLHKFKRVIKVGWHDPASKRKYYSNAMSYHLHNAIIEIKNEDNTNTDKKKKNQFQIDLTKVLLSSGNIESPKILSVLKNENQLDITWDTRLGPITNRFTDILAIIAYKKDKIAEPFFSVGTRKTGTASISLPFEMKEKIHVWAFYWNPTESDSEKNTVASDSVYLGEL